MRLFKGRDWDASRGPAGAQSHTASINLCQPLDNVTYTRPPSWCGLMGVCGFDLATIIHSIYGYPIGAAVLSLKVGQRIDLVLWNTGIKSAIHRVSLNVYCSPAFVCSLRWMRRRAEIFFWNNLITWHLLFFISLCLKAGMYTLWAALSWAAVRH